MTNNTKRTTVYLDPDLHRTLQLKAIESETSVSNIINEAIKALLLEDAEDLATFDERAGDRLISYEDMVKKLKKDGRI